MNKLCCVSYCAVMSACLHTRCMQTMLFGIARSFMKQSAVEVRWTSRGQQRDKFNRKTQPFTRKKEYNLEEFQMDHISETTRILYRGLRLKQPYMQEIFTTLESVEIQNSSSQKVSPSSDLVSALKIINHIMPRNRGKETFFVEERNFQANCERMSNHELIALVYHMVSSNNGKAVSKTWPDQTEKLFIVLERELCRRLNSCFQTEHTTNKEFFQSVESILHILLQHKAGFRLFQTYVRYCTYRSVSAVTVENLPLLLLSLCRVRFDSQMVFAFLEDFILRHFSSLDLKTVSLFCVTFFICNMPVDSEQLLSQIAMRLLHNLKQNIGGYIPPHDIINVLKILRHSGYAKVSFYSELEHFLAASNYIGSCNMTQVMQILNTYSSFKIYPSELLECMVQRVKVLLREHNITRYRIKDLSTFVNMLGTYQYVDSASCDIYTLCVDAIIKQLQRSEHREPSWYKAMYLCSCLTGLLYAGKFNEDIADSLFRIPNVADCLEETRRAELLMLHHTIELEYPHYKGRKIKQADIDSIQEKVSEAWNLEKELDVSGDLKDQVVILKSLIGEEKMTVGYILPYLRTADITIFLDDSDRLVQPQFAKKKVAVEVVAWGQCIRGTDTLLGKFTFKLKQLEKLGYQIITVGPQERYHVMQYGSSRNKREFWIKKLQDGGVNIDRDMKIKTKSRLSLNTKQGRKRL